MTEQEMLKEALEWQEHIRKLITATDDELYHKRSKVFYWLLERVQELEETVENYKTVNKELHQRGRKVRKQNKRYREALEEIKSHQVVGMANWGIEYAKLQKIAHEALEGE